MAKHITSEELEGSTPLPTPDIPSSPAIQKARARKTASEEAEPIAASESVSPSVEIDIATPKPSRKAKLKSGTAVAASPPDYAALGLDPEKAKVAEGLRQESLELGRKSTSTVFEWGRISAALHALADDQAHYGKLTKGVLGLSRRGAENYERVYERLAPHRERLVRVGIIASGLYELATAEPDQVEEVLAASEAGQKLTVAQIKAMVGKGGVTPAVSAELGGAAGLKARIAEKTQVGVSEFMDAAAVFLEELLVALDPYRQGKRIVVKDTQPAFIYPARILREQLEWLTWRAVPEQPGRFPVSHEPVVRGDRWHEVWQTLVKLGGFESWPPAAEVGPWLNDTVVPQLLWLLGDRAKKPLAVVNRLAAAAEAEQAKAEKERERAKAEQKKARQKAKRERAKAGKRGSREAAAEADHPAATAPAEDDAAIAAVPNTGDA